MSASREKRLRKESKVSGPIMNARQKREQKIAKNRRIRNIVISVLTAAVLFVIVLLSGILPMYLTVLTIDGVKIKGAEFDYHYFELVAQYDEMGYLELFDSEHLEEMAVDRLKDIVAQSEAAIREGITLTPEDIENIEAVIANLSAYAEMEGISTNKLLRGFYGRGINEKSYRAILERNALAYRYEEVTKESYDRSETVLEGHYRDNKNDYDFADYHAHYFPAAPQDAEREEEPYTEEELDEFRASQKIRAEDMLKAITETEGFAAGDFQALSLEYPAYADDHDHDHAGDNGEASEPAGDNGEDNGEVSEPAEENGGDEVAEDAAEERDLTLITHMRISELGPIDHEDETMTVAKFVGGASTEPGDAAVVESGEGIAVIYFLRRYRHDEIPNDVRHLLIQVEEERNDVRHLLIKAISEEEVEAAEADAERAREEAEFNPEVIIPTIPKLRTAEEALLEAERLLQLWKDTCEERADDEDFSPEDYFAELVATFTEDEGSAHTGGLYAGITPTSQYMEEFRDWATAAGRQPGDTGIVEVEGWYHGFHIMYYVQRQNDPVEDARAEAERLLELWKDGEMTEESFAALATAHSQDPGSQEAGGLYENVTSKSGFVAPFQDWAVDPGREPGDTVIVEAGTSDYRGFHVMYYVARHEQPMWMTEAKEDMNNKEYGEHMDSLKENMEVKRNGFAMLFTKRI